MMVLLSQDGGTRSWVDRAEAGCLAGLIVVGSALVWIGVPIAGFWLAARVAPNGITAVLSALIAIPVAMAAAGWLLARVSARYESLRGGVERRRGPPAWRVSLSEERASDRRRAGERRLIDIAMTVSAAAALLALTIWFFFFAELRLSPFP
jgi:ABC-type uncharacterized transport system permease subunit